MNTQLKEILFTEGTLSLVWDNKRFQSVKIEQPCTPYNVIIALKGLIELIHSEKVLGKI